MSAVKRLFVGAGAGVGGLLLLFVAFFFWASSGGLSKDELAQIRQYPAEPASTTLDTVTVMTYNIGYLSGMTNNEPVVRPDSLFASNMNQAANLIRDADPDIIGVQEIDYGGARVGHVHQLDTIATRLSYPTAAQAVNWDERYLPFPYGWPSVNFGRTISGQAVLSRHPIRQHNRSVLPRPPQPFFRDAFYLDRLAQVAVIDLDGRPVAVVNLHLEAYHTGTRETQIRQVRRLYDRLVGANVPTLIIGDLNSELSLANDTATTANLTSADDTMRLLLDDMSLRLAFPDSTYREGPPPATFPADAPTQKIDYILYPPEHFAPVTRHIQCGAPSPPSDHCAVTASFRLRKSAAEWPTPDPMPSLDRLLTN
jgi:endonuclease/exonuclease/phosphatase family metal-dependent hydrolase